MQKEITCMACNSNQLNTVRYNNHLNKIKPKIKNIIRKSIFSNKEIIICQKCGFGQTFIKEEKLDDYYKNSYWDLRSEKTEDYNGYKSHPRGIYQLKFVKEKIKTPSKVLEIGGGFCNFSLLLRDDISRLKIYSDEISLNLIDYYKNNKINLYQKPEGDFDHIHLSHVLEHISNPQTYLNNLLSILNFKGSIYVEVPNTNKDYFNLNFIDEPHVNFFTKSAFQQLAKKNKLQTSEIETFGPTWDELYDFKKGEQTYKNFYTHDFDNKSKNGCLIRFLIYK